MLRLAMEHMGDQAVPVLEMLVLGRKSIMQSYISVDQKESTSESLIVSGGCYFSSVELIKEVTIWITEQRLFWLIVRAFIM